MNTIIIHPFNRVKSTPMHDASAALIAPVSKWYRKPTPWWIDGFEEVGLRPIVETDEIAEEEEDVIYEEEETVVKDEEPEAEGVALSAFADVEPTCEDTFKAFQGNNQGEQNSLNETDMFQGIALGDIALDHDQPEIDGDPRDALTWSASVEASGFLAVLLLLVLVLGCFSGLPVSLSTGFRRLTAWANLHLWSSEALATGDRR
ncbi:hypothetical protein AX14_004664, partial [Amanita brunnescens Koide BX004]